MKSPRLLHSSPEVKCAVNLALLQGVFWSAWAYGNYGNYYLQENGFVPSQIGVLNALSSIAGILSSLLFGYLSDRINSIKKTLFIAMAVTVVMLGLTPLLPLSCSYSFALILIYFSLTNFFRGIAPTLLDNLSVRSCAIVGINFGLIRCIGSITFSVCQIIISRLLSRFSSALLFPVSSLMLIPALILLGFSYDPKLPKKEDSSKERLSLKPLLNNYYYITFIVFSAIFYLAYNCEFNFITYFMEERQMALHKFGIFNAVRALTEVPTLLATKRLRHKIRLKYIVAAACILISVYFLGVGLFARTITTMMLFSVSYGLGNGLLIGAFSTYLYKLAPNNLKATAQTIFSAVTFASGIIGNFSAGFVYDALGGGRFYALLGGITFLATAFLALSLLIRKRLPNPGDELN